MSMAIDGLATGLDTTSIINQLMAIERRPIDALQKRIDGNKEAEKAWYGIRTNLNKVDTAAKKLRVIGDDFMPTKVSSSLDSVSATSTAGAQPATATFTVNQLAKTQSAITSTGYAKDHVVTDQDTTISFKDNDGNETSIDIKAGTTLEQLRDKINENKDELGVGAALINTGDGTSRLQINASKSGLEGKFTADLSGLNGITGTSLNNVQEAQDAMVTLTGSSVQVTSSTNTFNDAIDGMSFTISKDAIGEDVTLTITNDESELVSRVKGFVDAINEAIEEIDAAVDYGIDWKGGKGEAKGVAGKLAGNATARSIRDSLLNAVAYGVEGSNISMGSIGVEVTREGKLEFKEDKFKEALTKDPQAVETLIRGDGSGDDKISVTARMRDALKTATEPANGTIQSSINSLKSINESWSDQIESMDDRLIRKRAQLQSQFTSLESSISAMKQQQNWLMGQLGSLMGPMQR